MVRFNFDAMGCRRWMNIVVINPLYVIVLTVKPTLTPVAVVKPRVILIC